MFTNLPIFVSSSKSDGDRLVRRQSDAIIPTLNIKQHKKSITRISIKTAPIAMPIIAADDNAGLSTRITKSEPKISLIFFFFFERNGK